MIDGTEGGFPRETTELSTERISNGRLPVDLDVVLPVDVLVAFRGRCSRNVDIL